MGFIEKAYSVFGVQYGRSRLQQQPGINYLDTAVQTRTGESITPANSLKNSTVFACVNVIADTTAQLDWDVYTRTQDGEQRISYNVTDGVMRMPNDVNTSYEFKHAIVVDMLTYGNAFVLISRRQDGTIVALTQLDPAKITPQINSAGRLVYRYREVGNDRNFSKNNIIHIRDFSANNLEGLSRVDQCANLVALSNAIEYFSADVFRNGNALSGILKTDQSIPPEQQEEILKLWKENYSGSGRDRNGVAFLSGGLEFEASNLLTPVNADLLAMKKYNDAKICGVFRVPTSFLEISDTSKYNNVSQKQTSFYRDTLAPILTNLEQKFTSALLADRPDYYIKFNTSDIIRGDRTSQINNMVSAVRNGILTPNEGRSELDYNKNSNPAADELIITSTTVPGGNTDEDNG